MFWNTEKTCSEERNKGVGIVTTAQATLKATVGCAKQTGRARKEPQAHGRQKVRKFPSSRLTLPVSDVGDRGDGSVKDHFSKSTSTALTGAETRLGGEAVGLLKEFTI